MLQKFISRALNGEALKVDGDGSMRLDFTYVDDAAQAIELAATKPEAKGETFNITRGQAESLKSAIDIIQKEIPTLKVEYGPVPAYMPKRGTLDVTKARTLLGYEPQYDLAKGLKIYIDHLRKNPI